MSEKVVVYEVQSDISPVTKAGALLVSWLLTYTIASVSQSQFVLANSSGFLLYLYTQLVAILSSRFVELSRLSF